MPGGGYLPDTRRDEDIVAVTDDQRDRLPESSAAAHGEISNGRKQQNENPTKDDGSVLKSSSS